LVTRATLCHIISNDSLLLKMANRGISKGKWNGPGGKFEKGETPKQCAVRETLEETGLLMKNPFYHGRLLFFMDGKRKLEIIGYLFSARKFTGKIRPSEEGEVRWFKIGSLPYERMWDDDKAWINLMVAGKRFDAYFYYGKGNKKVKECIIKMRK